MLGIAQVGESYGTTRCSGLALQLQEAHYIYINVQRRRRWQPLSSLPPRLCASSFTSTAAATTAATTAAAASASASSSTTFAARRRRHRRNLSQRRQQRQCSRLFEPCLANRHGRSPLRKHRLPPNRMALITSAAGCGAGIADRDGHRSAGPPSDLRMASASNLKSSTLSQHGRGVSSVSWLLQWFHAKGTRWIF